MSYVFHRTLNAALSTVVGGEGNWLITSDNKRYLDACGGAAVSCLGHDNASVRQAIRTQLDRISFAHSGQFTNQPAEDLAQFLVERAPKGTGQGRVMYLGSGSEAMEAALKLARQYHLEQGHTDRTKIIARKPSYHGNSLGALATGGHAKRRAPFQPLLMDVAHIDAPYAYRNKAQHESVDEFATRMANLLLSAVGEIGAENVMAFVAEPVVGASLGSAPAPKGYFQRIREICDEFDIVLIVDEVMCGMGRTGSLFALEQEGIHADITTIAKGLGAGYQPIGAAMASQKIVDVISANSGQLWNGHTYMSHALSCAGALAVQQVIARENLLENVRTRATQLQTALQEAFGDHPHVGDIRGRGLFWSIELVANKDTKAPYPKDLGLAMRIQQAAMEGGIMIYPVQGCADGSAGDHILIAPSYTSSADEIAKIVAILFAATNAALDRI